MKSEPEGKPKEQKERNQQQAEPPAEYNYTVIRKKTNEGKYLNEYRWSKEIGDGPHSQVRLVMRGQQPFAIKKYNLGLLKKKRLPRRDSSGKLIYDSTADKVRREVEVHRRLLHPHICRVFEVIEDREEEKLYMVMEYCGRGELATWDSKNDRFFLNQRAKEPLAYYLRGITQGVAYCIVHRKGVAHRDLKPMNILLTDEGEVKIADFGCAKMVQLGQLLKGSEGTYHFMAPEMLSELFPQGYDPFKCDIWSLGVTFYALVFWKLPFLTEPLLKLFEIIIKGEYTFPNKQHPFVPLISLMLSVDPSHRPSAEEILAILNHDKNNEK